MKSAKAVVRGQVDILREYGPFEGAASAHDVTHDGERVWFATGGEIRSFDPKSGQAGRALPVASDAGTAFDGTHLFQLTDDKIQRVDPATGEVLGTIPAPGQGKDSGLTWAEGSLWVGQYRDRKIHQIDPDTGAILRTIESDRFVTGVTWDNGELWHGTWEDERSDLRRIDPVSGEVLAKFDFPEGTTVSGLESDGAGVFYCGGGNSGKVRAVKRPSR